MEEEDEIIIDNNNHNNNNNGIVVSDSKGEGFTGFSGKRSIAERRGFNSNAARINTARFRTTATTTTTTSAVPLPCSPSPSPSPCSAPSPRLTIPPGISPTALLDSPIMLPNSQAMPSPTTGTFLLMPHEGSIHTSVALQKGDVDVNVNVAAHTAAASSSFKFKPHAHADPNPLPLNQVSSNCHMVMGGNADCQSLVQVQPPLDFSFPADFQKGHTTKSSELHSYNDLKMVNDAIVNANNVEMPMSRSKEASDESTLPKNTVHGEDVGQHPFLEGDLKETSNVMGMVRTSEDGYNWRKYGQKQVKGSEYPRSYYKCTHPNCQVKKKVERSHDGQITEIIYKGAHNHAKPHPSRRVSALSTDEISDMGEASGTCPKVDGGSVWRNIQSGVQDTKHSLDWKADELSSTLASHDGDEDGATQGSISLEDDADDEESESKRRKKESCLIESNLPSRALREPRVVVQIESEVDILDDGYRWRKYGQKVVKGNPNPRSYYKCTSAGCLVRKHVERASHNLKYVITTYEGKHNHEVPTSRNNNQISTSGGGGGHPGATNAQVGLTLPGNASIVKPETQVQTLAPHFDRKSEFSNEFLRPSLVGSFSNDIKFGSSAICQTKYSSLNNSMPYGSYGLNADRCANPQAGSIASMFPDFPMSLPLNLPSSGNFSLAGLNFNCVKPMGPVQSFLSGQQLKEIDTGLLRPKQEQKDDHIYGTCIPPVDHANASITSSSASSSLYRRVMQNFPS